MTPQHTFKQNDAGLSLLEVLIAISLMSLITIVVMGGIGFGTQVWASNDRAYDRLDDDQTMERLLRRHINHILPIRMENGRTIAFEGTAKRFQYLSDARLGDWVQGIHAERVELEGHRATLWVNAALLADLSPPRWTSHPLGETWVSGFRYLDASSRQWSSHWLHKDRLPALIAIDFEDAHSPPLILEPKVTLSGLTLDSQAQARLMFATHIEEDEL